MALFRSSLNNARDMNDLKEAFEYAGTILKSTFPEIKLTDSLLGRLSQIDNAMTAIPQDVRDAHTHAMRARQEEGQ